MRESIKIYIPLAGLALLSRLLLSLWPAQAVTTAQTAVLQWPVFIVVLLLGFPAMYVAHQWGTIDQDFTSIPLLLRAIGMGLVAALFLIVWDILFVLPRDVNVVGLISIPFYLTGAFFVEVVQHLIPLAAWLGIVGQFIMRGRREAIGFWIGALFIAVLEPLLQLGGGIFVGYSAAFFIVAAVLMYLINLLQLYLFRQGGFAPMFLFRLGMYLLWHVIWGAVRLRVLL